MLKYNIITVISSTYYSNVAMISDEIIELSLIHI